MRKYKIYPQEVKDEIITKFKRSGLSQIQFCNLSEVPITNSTLSKWLRRDGSDKLGNPLAKRQEPAPSGLNIVCYNIGESSSNKTDGGTAPKLSLSEMIEFQQDVYDCCRGLYRLSCNEQNIRLLSQIKGVLR